MKYIKSIMLAAILLTTTYAPINSGIGGNTVAPQKFRPLKQFAGKGLVGNYFSSSQTATIHDPSGENSTSYTFNSVVPYSQTVRPPQGVAFGVFKTPNWSSTTPGGPTRITTLYGVLVPQTTPAQ